MMKILADYCRAMKVYYEIVSILCLFDLTKSSLVKRLSYKGESDDENIKTETKFEKRIKTSNRCVSFASENRLVSAVSISKNILAVDSLEIEQKKTKNSLSSDEHDCDTIVLSM